MFKKVFFASLFAFLFLAGNVVFAISEAKWTSPDIQLNAPKAKVLEIMGKPDSIDTGSEMYLVSDSKELLMCVVEYKNEVVSVLGQIYKPGIGIKDLEEKMKNQGLTPLSKSDAATVYFTKMPTSDLEYYLVINASTEENTGPGLARMTKDAFNESEKEEKKEEEKKETKIEEKKETKGEEKPADASATPPVGADKPNN